MMNNRILPTTIIALLGAVIGSFLMMLYASSHFAGVAGPAGTPAAVSAAPLVSGGSDQQRIINAVKRVKASVVAINVDVNGQQYVPVDPFMQQFFGQQGPGVMQPFSGKDSGSGFVYDTAGDIVTNAHVVNPAPGAHTTVTVVFANGRKEPAKVIAANVAADIAIVRVSAANLPPPLALANSESLQQGQWAIAVGEPYELQSTVTLGVISAFNRTEPIPNVSGTGTINFKGLLQTSAPINPGNSGGPLVDINGNVIGINQSTLRGGAQGIGFAIPSNTVRTVVLASLAHPGMTQGTNFSYIGVELVPLSTGFRQETAYRGSTGVGVFQVFSGSPADSAGLQPGDVILSANGKAYDSRDALTNYVKTLKPGTRLNLQVWSQGNRKLISITTQEAPAGYGSTPPPDQQQ